MTASELNQLGDVAELMPLALKPAGERGHHGNGENG